MNPSIIYPAIALLISFGGLGATVFFNRKNVKVNEIEILKKDVQSQKEGHDREIKEIRDKLQLCEIARENLTRDRLMLLEQVAFGNAQNFAKNQIENKVDTIESPKVKVQAVE